MLYRGQSDIAAMHLLDPASQEYNLPFIHQLFVYESILVLAIRFKRARLYCSQRQS